MKFQITRVKEKILDDSKKKSQISYKGFRLLNSHNGNQNYKYAFKLLNDFQSKILYPAKLSIKTEIEYWFLRVWNLPCMQFFSWRMICCTQIRVQTKNKEDPESKEQEIQQKRFKKGPQENCYALEMKNNLSILEQIKNG